MKILFAYNDLQDDNEFVRIHVRLLREMGHTIILSLDEFWNPKQYYDYVIINWPEYFFKWRTDITDEEVIFLNENLNNIKRKGTKILTFFHDEYSHFGRNANLNLIFDICYSKSNILIHLGDYSANKYRSIYPDIYHVVINHPLYTDFNTKLLYEDSRKKINIKKDEYLVIVPGAMRTKDEISFAIKIFRNIQNRNKKLIFLRTAFLSKPLHLKNFTNVKEWVYYIIFKNWYRIYDNIHFLSGFMDKENLSTYFSASDFIIISRLGILNSGNIILAAQFGKPMIGTGVGNMGELLNILEQKIVIDTINIPSLHIDNFNRKFLEEAIKEKIYDFAGDAIIKRQWQKIFDL